MRTCITCKNPKCRECGDAIAQGRWSAVDDICAQCKHENANKRMVEQKREFSRKWAAMTPLEKLEVHGKVKLQTLAGKKNVNTTGSKKALIARLTPLCVDTDFPIRG